MDKGLVFLGKGEYAKAEAYARLLVGECRKNGNLSGEIQALLLLGKALFLLCRNDEALCVYTKLVLPRITSSEEYDDYLFGIIDCKRELGQLDDALKLAVQRCENTKGIRHGSAKKQVADILFSQCDYKNALVHYKEAKVLLNNFESDLDIATTLVELGEHDQAYVIRRKCQTDAKRIHGKTHPNYVKATRDLEFSYNSTTDAICSVCKKVATKPCNRCEEYWYCSSECQLSHWNAEHKVACLGLDALQMLSKKEEYVLAEFRARRAAKMYRNLKDHKKELASLIYLAGAIHNQGRFEDALYVYTTKVRSLIADEDYCLYLYLVADVLFNLNRLEEMHSILNEHQQLVYGRDFEFARVSWQFYQMLNSQGKYAEALVHCEKMVPFMSNSYEWRSLSILLSKTGNHERCLQISRQLVEKGGEKGDTEYALSLVNLALVYFTLARFELAIFYFSKSIYISGQDDDDECSKAIVECYSAITNKALTMRHAPENRMCGWCQKVAYCSTECQHADWPEHEKICKPRCAHCWKDGIDLQWCSGCEYIHYCSTECQLSDWNAEHKIICGRGS